ncbi:MAG: hypothetical protein HQK59_14305 [Deltaproteobacteria bacterium]|nr:hypothetical protein [Deltaproteobacteria bacterium]
MEYFDTLSVYDRLAKAGLPDLASRELSEILRGHLQQQIESLATKRDIEELRLGTKQDIEELKTSIAGSIEVLRLTTQRDIAELKKDIEASRLATQRDIAESRVDTIKWVVGLLVAQSAIIIAAVGVLVKLLK